MTSKHIAKGRGVRHVGSPRGKPLTDTRKKKAEASKETTEATPKTRMTFNARREQYLAAKGCGLNSIEAGGVLFDSGATLGIVLRVKKACGDIA